SAVAAALREALAKDARIHGWQIRSVRRSGVQSYLVKTDVEAERSTSGETHEVQVFVKNGDKIGRTTINLGPEDRGAIAKKLDDAVYMAGLGGDAPWALPANGTWP